MNVISILEDLLGLSQQSFSAGSFLQLKDRFCFQHDDEAAVGSWPQSSVWIVGRELLLFLQLDLRAIAKKQRNKVIERKVEQASPFTRTGHHSQDQDGLVMLWLWDENLRQAAVEDAMAQYSVLSNHILNLSPIPETVVKPRGRDGELIQPCSEGVDVQQWQDGVLTLSRWRSDSPGQPGGFIETPWSIQSDRLFFTSETLLWRLGLLLLCLVLLFQIGAALGAFYADNRLDDRLTESRERIAEVAQIRGQVRKIHQENAQLVQWVSEPGQLAVLAEFDRLVPGTAKFLEWDYQDRRLKVVIEDRKLNNRVYLEALSTSELFSDVQVSPGSKSGTAVITVEMDGR